MKLGLKIILPVLFLLLFILGTLGYLLYNLRQQEDVISTQASVIQKLNGLNERLGKQQEKTEYNVLAYRFSRDKTSLVAISQAELDKSKTLDEMSPYITTANGRELVTSYIASRKEVESFRNQLVQAIDEGNEERITSTYNKWSIQTQNIKAALADLKAYNINSLEKTIIIIKDIRNEITQIITVLTFLLTAIVIFLYFYLRIIITNPIIKLAQFADKVANKNFTTATATATATAIVNNNDEIGMLARSFNTMIAKLKEYYSELEQKVNERTQELAHEKAKDDAILASIGDGIVAVDLSGKVIFANNAIEGLVGWKKEEIVGESWFDVVPMKDEEGNLISINKRPIKMAIDQRKTTTSNLNNGIYYFDRKNKSTFPVAVTASPIILNGEVMGAIGVFRDISHEIEVDTMKTDFISLASHQLRTPLSAMKWFSEMLLAGDAGKLEPEQKEYIQNIYDSNDRMIKLVNGLLNISRIESGRLIIDPKPTDLKEIVDTVLTELSQKIEEKNLKLTVSIHENLPKINIDPKLIEQVYLNLLTNSIKYTPNGGEISITVSKNDQEIISQISDTGLGVPSKDQSKVFTKFFRAENIIRVETEGSGLGLYLVKSIIESSGGKIWFESQEGKGTSFYFGLPLSGSKAQKGEVNLSS